MLWASPAEILGFNHVEVTPQVMQSQDFAHEEKGHNKYCRLNWCMLTDEVMLFRENEIQLIFTNLVFA